jgi:hypothetical protein
MEKQFKLKQEYGSPTETITVGTAKTEKEWRKVFTALKKGDCSNKNDWFDEVIETPKKKGFDYHSIKTVADAIKVLKIKTYGDAYRVLQLKRKMFANTPISECDDPYLQRMIVAAALNLQEDGVTIWRADRDNTNQKKWYCYFAFAPFRFDGTSYGYGDVWTDCGLRLCFETEDRANFFGTQFIDLHKADLA